MVERLNIWSTGLFTLIALFYVGAFLQNTLAWAPFAIVLLLMVPRSKYLDIGYPDIYNMRWLLALIVWVYASLIWSIDQQSTVDSLRNLIPKLAVLFFAYKFPVLQKRQVEKLGVLIAGIVSILAFYFLWKHGAVRISATEKAAYGISYANLIAAGIVAAMPLILFNKGDGWLTVANGMLLVCIVVVVFTESRAGIILVCLAVALSLAFGKSVRVSKWTAAFATAAVLLTVAYGVVQAYFPDVAERLNRIGGVLSVFSYDSMGSLERNEEDFARKMQMLYTIERIEQLPLVGVGYGAFGQAIERDTGFYVHSHSFFGTFFVELGLVGFLLFSVFNLSLAGALLTKVNDFRRPREARVARMAFVGWILQNLLFLTRPQMAELTYFVVLGLALAAASKKYVGTCPHRRDGRVW